jgi:acyl carrier protein
MSKQEIIDRLQTIITENLEHNLPVTLSEEQRLYEDLNIDSLMVLQLMIYIEEEFQVEVPEEDVDPEVFQTVRSLVQFIQELQKQNIA